MAAGRSPPPPGLNRVSRSRDRFGQHRPRVYLANPDPRVLSLLVAWRDFCGTRIKYLFLLAVSCNDLLFCVRNPGALRFHCRIVSPGDQPLTKKAVGSRLDRWRRPKRSRALGRRFSAWQNC